MWSMIRTVRALPIISWTALKERKDGRGEKTGNGSCPFLLGTVSMFSVQICFCSYSNFNFDFEPLTNLFWTDIITDKEAYIQSKTMMGYLMKALLFKYINGESEDTVTEYEEETVKRNFYKEY